LTAPTRDPIDRIWVGWTAAWPVLIRRPRPLRTCPGGGTLGGGSKD